MTASATPDRSASLERYLEEVTRIPVLGAGEERALARRMRAGDPGAAVHLISTNLRFVVRVAREYRACGIRECDLIQEGNLGLMRAVRRFDPERGVRLITYAGPWIRASILDFILRSWSMVRLGTTQAQRRLFFALRRTQRQLEREAAAGGGAPVAADESVAERLRVKVSELRDLQVRLDGRDVSLDAPARAGEGEGPSLAERLPAGTPRPDDVLEHVEQGRALSTQVARALEHLDRRERTIIEERLLADPPLAIREIARRFGVSRERTRQLEHRAMRKLELELRPLVAGP